MKVGRFRKVFKAIVLVLSIAMLATGCNKGSNNETQPKSGRQMEKLDRGLVAVKTKEGVFVSWRMFGTDPDEIAFNLYRNGKKVNSKPISDSTNYLDTEGNEDSKYYIRPVLKGKEQKKSEEVSVWATNYLSIPIKKPDGGKTPANESYTYSAGDASVGDLDGDGQYEIILKWDPSNAKDNSQGGYTGNVYIDAYKLDGTFMWRIDLGKNIRAGAHYTQFMVYDLDGDGKAELACKTADGTVDGQGNVIGDPDADWRKATIEAGYGEGYILEGPEYLTIFDGLTGKALYTEDYDPPRGATTPAEMKEMWGDNYGNRVDRFLACIAYLDGHRPSLVMCRGYYTRTVLVAYNWRDGQLTKLWKFDSADPEHPEYKAYEGQGNHNLSVADVDNDGKDEIIYGSCAIDDDGTGMYSTGLGHGDAMHVSDFLPDRPGLEVFQVHESKSAAYGTELHDAATGEIIWGRFTGTDVGRGLAADVYPDNKGAEFWPSGIGGLAGGTGEIVKYTAPSSTNFAIWWDGDLLRELLDGTSITSYTPPYNVFSPSGVASNNGSKATPCLQADLLGDWREEVIWRSTDSTELRLYTTTDITEYRIYTLMHDPVYRLGIAWQNVAYNQPPHTSFYLGVDMDPAPKPDIYLVD